MQTKLLPKLFVRVGSNFAQNVFTVVVEMQSAFI